MSRRRTLLRLAAAALVVVGAGLAVGPATAASGVAPDDAGWWWRLQDVVLPARLPAPPYVEDGELLVQGAPDGALAIAALRFSLPEGEAASPTLTLQVKDGGDQTGGQAVVLACLSGSGWSGAHAGAWQEKPLTDCSASVQGIPAEDGTSWTFAVAPLQLGSTVDVVIVPGEGSTFQLVFEEPDATTLETGSGDAAPLDFEPPPPSAFGSESGDGFAAPATDSPAFAPPAGPPVTVARPALPPDEQGRSATAPGTRLATQPQLPEAGRDSDGRAVGVLLLALGVAAVFYAARQPIAPIEGVGRFRRPATAIPATAGVIGTKLGRRQGTSSMATGTAATSVASAPTTGGLGRFARPRTGPPPRLT